ncbi:MULTISPECIES: DUF421 domain-containing protein [Clostridium]|uniref:DUF421 domain-containing protein n=1 Tax=Clostridium cibarium TaxID=2762247 RepID=A0ABR8PUJ9_9CLOT|nr:MULTISPECIES: DUF421 domain-containing protein [Clostridium]MBD7911853.1 DUF421 domain-containing protein [Clostridium cibarium]
MQNWIIVLIRTSIIFFLTLVMIRFMGKGSLSKMTPFKLVSYIVIAIIASLISLGLIGNLIFGLLSLFIWVAFSIALDYLSIKSKWVHDFINGRETVLIKNGKIMEENLLDVKLTGEELLKSLRSKNVFNLADVEFAVMETTGEINALLKSDKKPVTAHDLKQKVAPISEPQTVILDGNILDESLSNRGLNEEWLKSQLSNLGVSLDNVFLAQIDSSGDLYVDLFDDSIELPKPQVKELLYANISKAQADCLSFSLETNNPKVKGMYSSDSKKLEKMMNKLEPYLLR